jgi:hypothetical protein
VTNKQQPEVARMADTRVNRRVVCAAIRKQGMLVLGPRHFDETMHRCIRQMKLAEDFFIDAEQGFVDQFGAWLSRMAAWDVAVREGQILNLVDGQKGRSGGPYQLYSENLY